MNNPDLTLVLADMADLFPVFQTRTVRRLPPRVPLGLCYVAASVRAAGYRVSIIDNYLEGEPNRRVAERILADPPRAAGFSVTVVNEQNALEIAAMLKRSVPEIAVVFGGPQATISPAGLLARSCVDYVVTGEGEGSMPLLMGMLATGAPAVEAIPGVWHRSSSGGAVSTGPTHWIKDLDALPLPARDLVDFERYHLHGDTIPARRVATLSTSRGCPYRCTFCASDYYFPKQFRHRSAASVVDEIEHLIATYRVDGLYFREDCFTVNHRRIRELCGEMLGRGIQIPWECEARVDTVTPELLKIMHDAGCRGLWCGVESGSPRVLEILGKGITVDQIRNAYRWAREAGIAAGASFMVGVPGETMEDAFRSLALGEEIAPCWASFQAYVGYPRSRLYDEVEEKKLYVTQVNGIFDVQTEELTRGEIRALENYCALEFGYAQKATAAGGPAPAEPAGGWPSVTVIVPALDASRTIEECLVSLVNLDYPKDKLEIIVVDNGSRDKTRELAGRFPVTCMEQRETSSSYATRNVAIERAGGEIIAFTDSDCVAVRSWLKNLVAGCDDPRFGCFAGEVVAYSREDVFDEYLFSIGHMSHKDILEYKPLPRAQTANLAFRRAVFERCGLFDPDAISGGDSEMVIRMVTGTEWRVRYNGAAVVYHKHRTRPWPFFTQFVRYGWGEARIRCSYADYYHPRLGIGMGQSLSKIASDLRALSRGAGAALRGGEGGGRGIAMPLLDIVHEAAWHLGLQAGLLYRMCRKRPASPPPLAPHGEPRPSC